MADPEEVLHDFLARGLRWFETGRAELARSRDPEKVAQQRRAELAKRRDVAIVANTVASKRFENKVERSKNTTWMASSAAVLGAGLGTVDVVTLGVQAGGVIPGPAGWWYVGSAVCALIAARATWWRKHATPPQPATLPVVPPPILPADAIGAAEAAELVRCETAMWAMIPALAQVHPQAGAELRACVYTSQTGLYQLVERLAVLDSVDGDVAAPAETLRARLADGVGAYRRLLGAGAELLAAPDLSGRAQTNLDVAAEHLVAYAAGLEAAGKTFDPPQG